MPAERRGAITGATFATTEASSSFGNSSSSGDSMASGGFSFGSTTASSSFGAPAPAPTPLFGGFGTTSTSTSSTAPAAPLFGQPSSSAPGSLFGAPAPSTGGGLFGSTTPAPSTGLFGSTTPAPSTGLFGAPAPSTGLFGAPAPAFGAPAPAFGAPAPSMAYGAPSTTTTSLFGASTAPVAPPPPPQPPALAGNMPYAALPPEHKQAIDRLHEAMMQHKRTLSHVSTLAPKLLLSPTKQADAAAGQDLPLASVTNSLKTRAHNLRQQLETLRARVDHAKSLYETSAKQAVVFAKWPTEAVAMRRGVHLSRPATTATATTDSQQKEARQQLQQLLDRSMKNVDRVERMPSPYLWQVIDEMDIRLANIQSHLQTLQQHLVKKSGNNYDDEEEDVDITSIVRVQEQAIWKVATMLSRVHHKMETTRQQYRSFEQGENVLQFADQAERERQQKLDDQIKYQLVKAMPPPTVPPPSTGSTSLFGRNTSTSYGFGTPAPSGGLFGATPAPAFGAAPAPSGGLFGSTTPAPAPGGLFGTTPAPATGGLFGSTPAPAPSGGGLFGSTTPSAAPPPPSFGAAPAPGAFSFGPTASAGTSSTASTPKSKNKSRSSRRR